MSILTKEKLKWIKSALTPEEKEWYHKKGIEEGREERRHATRSNEAMVDHLIERGYTPDKIKEYFPRADWKLITERFKKKEADER
jgi:hypothetical protein